MSAAPAAIPARQKRLLEGPVAATLASIAAPGLVLAIVQSSVSFADAWFVGRIGTDALAGLSMVFPLIALMQMMSAGAVGGGVSSSIARALGAGNVARAEALAAHAIVIAIGFGLIFTAVVLTAGPALFRLLGGNAAAVAQAVGYASIVFGGAVVVWICNVLGNIVRGSGNLAVPAVVLSSACAVQIALTGALVLGFGPFPRMGIIGAAIGYLCGFATGMAGFVGYLALGASGIRLRWRTFRPDVKLFGEILRVGLWSSLNAVLTVATALFVTGYVGTFGTAALAGYGVGVRLELLQVPFVFALGAALVAMVGTAVGAGDVERARRASWIGGGLAAAMTGIIGLVVALQPQWWAGMFSTDPAVLDAGYRYLRIVGPCYAFLGLGIALYFASQGTGRIFWPVAAGSMRFVIAAIGGYAVVHLLHGSLDALFGVIAVALAVFGLGVAAATHWGVWRR
jgi:putative MATE family efflux protein